MGEGDKRQTERERERERERSILHVCLEPRLMGWWHVEVSL